MNFNLLNPGNVQAQQGLHLAIQWYLAAYLPPLRRMPPRQLGLVLQKCCYHSARVPLHDMPDAEFQVRAFNLFRKQPGKKLTGGQVIALLVAGMWVQSGENEARVGDLLGFFPELRAALILTQETPQ